MLKGIGGEYEINRVLGAAGVSVYIIAAPAFEAWEVFRLGKEFDVVAFCAAYPGGLGVAIGAIAGAVAVKDRNVAVARVTQDTGAAPGLAAGGAPAAPIKATIVNEPNDPVPVETQT
jgi:hypothetical protein